MPDPVDTVKEIERLADKVYGNTDNSVFASVDALRDIALRLADGLFEDQKMRLELIEENARLKAEVERLSKPRQYGSGDISEVMND